MALNPRINRWFSHLNSSAKDKDYYGPYNTLLASLFPLKAHYLVCPSIEQVDSLYGVQNVMTFTISHKCVPVLFVTVMGPSTLIRETARAQIDNHMRQRLTQLAEEHPTFKPALGISFMGPFFVRYQFSPQVHGDTWVPKGIDDVDGYNDRAPVEWWEKNSILTAEGQKQLKAIELDVKAPRSFTEKTNK